MAVDQLPQVITPDCAFLQEVEKKSGQKISACFQCEKCSNGCPVTFAMDIVPHKILRLVNLGLKDQVLRSDTIWVCAACETCTSRCPNDIDIAHVMDSLRQISERNGLVAQKNIADFHNAWTSGIERHGRQWELGMVLRYKLKSKTYCDDMKLGIDMLKKGKLKIRPSRLRAGSQVKRIFKESKGRG
jgi:heterodisulfide reductase subunit C